MIIHYTTHTNLSLIHIFSVISEHILDELKEVNKNIPSLPVAGVTIVGITGIRSKRVTKQVHLNMIINGVGSVSYTHLL